MKLGFIGIGHMGQPMAANLLRAAIPLTVWNRSAGKYDELAGLGADLAPSLDILFARCSTVMLMLIDSAAIDAVLGRGTPAFALRVADRIIVSLGTTSPVYSQALAQDIRDAGGRYVEAPVSGSRGPAERGELVGMLAGDRDAIDHVLPLLRPMCARVFDCGTVPGALRMKLAANHYLIGTVAVLAETMHAATRSGIDLALLRDVLDAGPMASTVSRTKLDKLVRNDFSPQAAIRDVATIAELVLAECERGGDDTPLIRECAALFRKAAQTGYGEADMAAVVHAFARPAS
jgi:3-hydroxyisobutyrate dehydrogenase